MVKPFDFTRLQKEHNKKHKAVSGFNDPITWIDTGNYALNKMISGDFRRGVPLGGVTVFAGESGSSKSYIVSGNIVKDALAQGIHVVVIDTEDALKKKWIQNLNVDPDHPLLVRYVKNLVNEIVDVVNDYTKEYRESYFNVPREEQPKMLFIVDSLGFLETDTAVEQFEKGELKGDKGIKAKQLKALVSQCIRLFAGFQLGLIATNHTYKSQDMYNPDDVISGGSGFIFASSIIVNMNKKKLKEDEDGQKTKEVSGIIAKIKCVKSRYAKPFEEVEVSIPYEKGMDKYSGIFAMSCAKGVITKSGNRWTYKDKAGVEHTHYRKDLDDVFFERIINEWDDSNVQAGIDLTPLDYDPETGEILT